MTMCAVCQRQPIRTIRGTAETKTCSTECARLLSEYRPTEKARAKWHELHPATREFEIFLYGKSMEAV